MKWIRALIWKLIELYNSSYGGGHITLIKNDELLYDGPLNKAPPWVHEENKALTKRFNEAIKSMYDIVNKVRNNRKK